MNSHIYPHCNVCEELGACSMSPFPFDLLGTKLLLQVARLPRLAKKQTGKEVGLYNNLRADTR